MIGLAAQREADAEVTRMRALPQGLARLSADRDVRDRYEWPEPGSEIWQLVGKVRRLPPVETGWIARLRAWVAGIGPRVK